MGNGGTNHQTSGAVAAKAERQVRAFELSLEGHSLRAVAALMTAQGEPISHETVRKLIELEAAERVGPVAEHYRTVLIERTNALRLKVGELLDVDPAPVTAGKDGDVVRDPETEEIVRDYGLRLSTVDRLIKLDERLAKLTGADAPQKVEGSLTATVTEVPADVAELLRQARERNAAKRAELSGRRV
ncbi:hypothetical protein [Amycolatopsis sp. Hca4]|uniref:hypothetical protein n=1 Tax=Amycolatopsis sp. Hca4 TaxID=2742131 RepID=UPI00159260E8|nr:hypothetical protein [Amycolatopsis sp. Hca4]QKV74551.1 hypothetical protein HUT10_12795 [Amycolatopsis sp. Hca4]